MYHGLDSDFRPLADPHGEPQPFRDVHRYRNLLYGFAKALAVLEEGDRDTLGPARPQRPPAPGKGEDVTAGGVVLPTGTRPPPR